MSRFHIIRDTREKQGHGWFWEENAYCSGTTIAKLDVGDYTIEGFEKKLCIERKESVSEFAGNCGEKRFSRVLDRMAEYEHSFLLFEFSWFDIERYPEGSGIPIYKQPRIRIKGKYMMRVITTTMVEKGIHVIACGDKARAEQMAFNIMRKVYEASI